MQDISKMVPISSKLVTKKGLSHAGNDEPVVCSLCHLKSVGFAFKNDSLKIISLIVYSQPALTGLNCNVNLRMYILTHIQRD